MSRATLSELRWPMDDESRQQAKEWASSISTQALDWTWRAFDKLRVNVLNHVDTNQPPEQFERDLTRNHFSEILALWKNETDGESSIEPHHEYPELETRAPAPAKPPAYDIAFVWRANRRFAFPIEAKVVATPGALAQYLGDTKKFTSGTAAPLVGEGAQIAYLLTGTEDDFFANLNTGLQVPLQLVSEFPNRPHRSSFHRRSPAPDLRLHHIPMFCGVDKSQIILSAFDE